MLKTPICCFRTTDHYVDHEVLEPEDGYNKKAQTSPRSPYAWLKSTAQELEIKDRCRGLIRRKGKSHRRRQSSSDFRYDAESYSLNFEDDFNKEDELPLHDFVARLPATPDRLPAGPRAVAVQPRREVCAWS